MRTITSANNNIIKAIVRLHTKKERNITGLFLAEGLRTVKTLLKSNLALQHIFVTDHLYTMHQFLAQYQKYITIVPEYLIQKMSTSKTSSELIATFYKPVQPHYKQLTAGIVLAQLSNPGNMGTLIRTAAALNISTIVIIKGVDPWSPKVIQATAGTIGFTTIFELTWQQLLIYKKNLQLAALTVSGGTLPNMIKANNSLIVIGNEAHGLPKAWQQQCDTTVTIPMPGKTESLNAAVAGSIAMYITYVNINTTNF